MSSRPVRSASPFSAVSRSTPARISAVTSASSAASSGWLKCSSSATRWMAAVRPRPASTQTTSMSSASGKASRRRFCRRSTRRSSTQVRQHQADERRAARRRTASCAGGNLRQPERRRDDRAAGRATASPVLMAIEHRQRVRRPEPGERTAASPCWLRSAARVGSRYLLTGSSACSTLRHAPCAPARRRRPGRPQPAPHRIRARPMNSEGQAQRQHEGHGAGSDHQQHAWGLGASQRLEESGEGFHGITNRCG